MAIGHLFQRDELARNPLKTLSKVLFRSPLAVEHLDQAIGFATPSDRTSAHKVWLRSGLNAVDDEVSVFATYHELVQVKHAQMLGQVSLVETG